MEGIRSSTRSRDLLRKIKEFTLSILEDLSEGLSPLIFIQIFRTYCTNLDSICSCRSNKPSGHEILTFQKESHVHRIDVLLRVLLIVQQLLQENKHASKRDIYYMHPLIFSDQSVVDRAINDICILLQCSRHNLNVVSVGNGLVMGWLRFLEAGRKFDCINSPNTAHTIPVLVEDVKDLVSAALYILVVEKESVFQRLENDKFCSKNRCIVITGRGYPDVPTRRFLRLLVDKLCLPVYCLVDCDPYGFDILATYRFGSMQMAYDAKFLRVPQIQWLGAFPSDSENYDLPKQCLLPLTIEDKRKTEAMLQRCYLHQEVPDWRLELELMLQRGTKFEIEALSVHSLSFLSEVYIPVSNDCSSKIIYRRVLSSGVVSSSSSSSNPSKETIIPSQSILSDNPAPPTPPPPAPEASTQVSGRKSWTFLKYGLLATVTGAIGYVGYLSYKCSYEEVEQKAKSLRAAASYTPSEDAAAVEKYRGMLYSAAMTVPAKALESYLDLRKMVEEHVMEFTEPTSDKLLPDLHPQEQHVFTLVLDLNETLLYTDWKRERGWRTFKRPGVDAFLEHMAKFYEIVVYSDQMNMYVDPVCERLDPNHYIRYRLSRGATKYQDGKHYRDLSKLNRDPAKILYVSAHAFESSLQPENCVPIKPYKLETDDTALLDLIPFLEYVARNSPADIRQVLQSYERKDVAKEFLERSKEYQRRMQGQRQQGRFWWR